MARAPATEPCRCPGRRYHECGATGRTSFAALPPTRESARRPWTDPHSRPSTALIHQDTRARRRPSRRRGHLPGRRVGNDRTAIPPRASPAQSCTASQCCRQEPRPVRDRTRAAPWWCPGRRAAPKAAGSFHRCAESPRVSRRGRADQTIAQAGSPESKSRWHSSRPWSGAASSRLRRPEARWWRPAAHAYRSEPCRLEPRKT